MKKHLTVAALAAAMGFGSANGAHALNVTNVLLFEDFNSLTLGPSVNERVSNVLVPVTQVASDPNSIPYSGVFSKSAPGWTTDNNFNALGDFNLSLNPDSDLSGDYDVNLDGPPAAGTIIGNVGIPNAGSAAHGVDEWEGWSFANKDWWITVAEDQDRSLFTLGTGTVAIADPDEYDDLGSGRGGGYYNSGLKTPTIDISSAGGGFLGLLFDSSFVPEAFDDAHTTNAGLLGGQINNQTAAVWATYGGTNPRTERVFIQDSDGGNSNPSDGPLRPASPTFAGPGAINETKAIGLSLLPGDTDVQITFGMMNAGNDWWWAIDNIDLQDGLGTSLFKEDFEGVTLGDSINERQGFSRVTENNDHANSSPRPDSFTHTAPASWNRTVTLDTGIEGDNNLGVYEWEGWSFATLDFWNFADLQGRQNFANADGTFAIADGDEWTDWGSSLGQLNTLLETPAIDISGVAAGALYLQFDSSWRTENPQVGEILVDYHDGNGPQVVFTFDSASKPLTTETAYTSENLLFPLNNPVGATSATVSFRYQGGNNWWWAIDNIRIGTVPEPTSLGLSLLAAAGLGLVRRHK